MTLYVACEVFSEKNRLSWEVGFDFYKYAKMKRKKKQRFLACFSTCHIIIWDRSITVYWPIIDGEGGEGEEVLNKTRFKVLENHCDNFWPR